VISIIYFTLKILNFNMWNNSVKKGYINPLYKKDPLTYTSKGKIRIRISNPFNYPKTSSKSEDENIPEKIQYILIGSLLGDCSGEMQKNGKYPTFAFKQSIKHMDYLFYIYFIFLHWGYAHSFTVPKIKNTKDSRGNKHDYLRFGTITTPNLFKIYKMFYKYENNKRIKIVTKDIGLYMTPRALAFWIMDDGSKGFSGILLHTNSYTYEEVLLLINTLKNKFNIESKPRKKYNKFIIYIYAKSVPLVVKKVKSHMHPKFYYKLGIS